MHLAYWCGKPRERDHLDDVSVNGGQFKMDLLGILWGRGVDWINLAEDSCKWRALVNAVKNFLVP